ncbi:SURF1 family protein [Fulvimarina endophytica]|uniref:SURF1-like protein n=1 Tax=Fulvimarina endophytica TaxID=2293836 RepID=A0A371X0B1_9HYPH|nr:SURF1 family protein [Fulvimarina endophytica]RFC62625.1 SURF1 family protein [Fulvimarina endophytica]
MNENGSSDSPDSSGADRGRRGGASRSGLAVIVLLGGVLTLLFCSLGVWQIERRAWKLDLIAAVEARVTEEAIAAPGPAEWPDLTLEGDEYQHVAITGRYLEGRDAYAQAVTDYGSGYWLMTPLGTADGFTVFVNRGYVSRRDGGDDFAPPDGEVRVEGLLRMSQPDGAFLRSNDPQAGRWYSRDTAAMAAANDVPGPVAPYFIDAGVGAERALMGEPSGEEPVEGLTNIAFRNEHLVYAITWFSLAALTLGATGFLVRRQLRRAKRD